MTETTLQAAEQPRYPNDEFDSMRARQEAHPTMESYLATRSDDEIAALTWSDIYRRNVFGTYPGTTGEHTQAMIAAVRNRSTPKPMTLKWKKLRGFRIYEAVTPFGVYSIQMFPDTGNTYIGFADKQTNMDKLSLTEAKTLVQESFERSVRGCLTAQG